MRTSINILTFKYKKMKQSNVEENIPENVSVDYGYSGSDEENNNYLRTTEQGMVILIKVTVFGTLNQSR